MNYYKSYTDESFNGVIYCANESYVASRKDFWKLSCCFANNYLINKSF